MGHCCSHIEDQSDPIQVVSKTSTSLTLRSTRAAHFSSFLEKADEILPEVQQLTLLGVFHLPSSINQDTPVPKHPNIKTLVIQADRGSVIYTLRWFSMTCPELIDVQVAFENELESGSVDIMSESSISNSLRNLKLTVRYWSLKNIIDAMKVISVVYPNVGHLDIIMTKRFHSHESDDINVESLQLNQLDDIRFSTARIDQVTEKKLKRMWHTLCPHLAHTTTHDGTYLFRRICGVSDYVDEKGGELVIPTSLVKLTIPPGALEDEEKISMEYFTDLPGGMHLDDNESIISHGYRCFPSGCSFKKAPTVTLHHSAVIKDPESIVVILHSGCDGKEEVTRVALDKNQYVIHSDKIDLHIQHFSWGIPTFMSIYDWIFPGKRHNSPVTKLMLCTPFIPKMVPKDQDHPIMHVQIYNKLPGLYEETLKKEDQLNYVTAFPEQELIVKDNSTDVSVSCESVDPPSSQPRQCKNINTKELMRHTWFTVCMTLHTRRSIVSLVVSQESEICMQFFTDIKDKPESPERVLPPVLTHPNISDKPESTQRVRVLPPEGILPPILPPKTKNKIPTYPLEQSVVYEIRSSSLPCLPLPSSGDSECVTDGELEDLSRRLPLENFNSISIKLGFTMNETQNFKQGSRTDEAYFTLFRQWKGVTGAPRKQLVDVLRRVKLSGIVESTGLEHDSPQKIID